jgi:hypothetical protein
VFIINPLRMELDGVWPHLHHSEKPRGEAELPRGLRRRSHVRLKT